MHRTIQLLRKGDMGIYIPMIGGEIKQGPKGHTLLT